MSARVLSILAILGGATAVGPDHASAVQSDTIFVALNISYGDGSARDQAVESELLSYFRRELRSLGDVVVGLDRLSCDLAGVSPCQPRPAFKISVPGLPLTTGGADTPLGHALTVGVARNCHLSYSTGAVSTAIFELPEALFSANEVGSRALVEWLEFMENCGKDVFRNVYVWPSSVDLLQEVRSVVARLDTQLFETLRRP